MARSMALALDWDALPPTIPRPKEYGPPQTVQMISTECPYTSHGLSVRGALAKARISAFCPPCFRLGTPRLACARSCVPAVLRR